MVGRSIGVQVNLCNCHCLLGQSAGSLPPRSPRGCGSSAATAKASRHHFSFNKALSVDTAHPCDVVGGSILQNNRDSLWGSGCVGESFHFSSASGNTTSHLNNSSRTARSSVSEMDSLSEADENNRLLEGGGGEYGNDNDDSQAEVRRRTSSNDHDRISESTRLIHNSDPQAAIVGSPPLPSSDAIHRQIAADILNKRDSHGFHGKRKFNFRSDSVFSDVMPMSSNTPAEVPKTPEAREKSGSLSSLKGNKDSKWASLRKKLGRLNSSSSDKQGTKALEQQAHQFQQHHQQAQQAKSGKPPGLLEKRSLLQRAKTLAILPVKNAGAKEEIVKKPKEIAKPPELFNVGGEMNMIPLELLIDINDLKMQE